MSKIDWSKAPSDATHYHPAVNGYVEHWFKPGHFCVLGFEDGGWKYDDRNAPTSPMISRPVDGGKSMLATAAFPSPGVVIDYNSNQHQQGAYEGMSLRDYFAAKFAEAQLIKIGGSGLFALGNPCRYDGGKAQSTTEQELARISYVLADAMLAERAK